MIRDDGQRTLLYDLDQSIQELSMPLGVGHPQTVKLAGIYHNVKSKSASQRTFHLRRPS